MRADNEGQTMKGRRMTEPVSLRIAETPPPKKPKNVVLLIIVEVVVMVLEIIWFTLFV